MMSQQQATGMTTLANQRMQYAAALARDLDDLVRQLADMPEVERVNLFGSYAVGRRDLLTDLDLLLVMASPLDFVARQVDLAGRVRAGVALDLLAYTPQEIERMRDRPFIRDILQNGKVLYEKRRPTRRGSIPTRYPNGLPDDIPARVYNRQAVDSALALAEAWFSGHPGDE